MADLKLVKSTGQRQAELRQRRAETGLTEVRGIYACAEQQRAIKAYAKKMANSGPVKTAPAALN